MKILTDSKPLFRKPLIITLTNKTANIISAKLASVLYCKIHRFRTTNIKTKFHLHIISTEVIFYIHDRPLTGRISFKLG